jgi:transcriptional regulator with XRE-family HTH domain
MEINPFALHTPETVATDLAGRVRALRLEQGLKQSTLAERSGVSLGSLRRFEDTGAVSLDHFLKLVFTLGRIEEVASWLETRTPTTMAELEARHARPQRRRGRK